MAGRSFAVVFLNIFFAVFVCATAVGAEADNFDVRDQQQHLRHPNVVKCDTDRIERRLANLEERMREKAYHLLGDVKEGNRKLDVVSYQNAEITENIEALKNEIGQLADASSRMQRSAERVGSNGGFFVLFNTMVKIYEDIALLKKNLTQLITNTNLILERFNEFSTKDYVNNQARDSYPEIPPNLFQVPFNNQSLTARNCKDVQNSGESNMGIFTIQPETSKESFLVVCDFETRDGGWTYIHNRFEGAQNFDLTWNEYKNGFGNLAGEFWLGLDHLHELTGYEVNELLVELVNADGQIRYAHYSAFSIGTETEGYPLKILGGYQGDAGDSLTYHAGARFSTADKDQDVWSEGNCAKAHSGAWWYKACDKSNLNGKFIPGDLPESLMYQGMYWDSFGGPKVGLVQSRMMIRPRGADSPPIFVKNNFKMIN